MKNKSKIWETIGGIALTLAICALVVLAVVHIPEHATSVFWRP